LIVDSLEFRKRLCARKIARFCPWSGEPLGHEAARVDGEWTDAANLIVGVDAVAIDDATLEAIGIVEMHAVGVQGAARMCFPKA